MTGLFLSRIRLKRDASAQALAPLFLPPDAGGRSASTHHWIWSLFADTQDRRRDFLWREDGGRAPASGLTFYTLSARRPDNAHNLFEVDSKPFAPVLAAGDRLRFSLRASPTTGVSSPGRGRSKRKDPVALALAKFSPEEREAQRHSVTSEVGRTWLAAQGSRSGFILTDALTVDDDWCVLARGNKARPISFGVLNFEGILEVREPELFAPALAGGFGKAKAFGCGLMLIRRE